MAKVYKVNLLNASSVRKLRDDIADYRIMLPMKMQKFVSKLADKGITVAQENRGDFGNYITFEKQLDPTVYGCTSLIIGSSTQELVREWRSRKDAGGWAEAHINPLLMAEFGSGFLSQNPLGVEGVGQGTFPEDKGGRGHGNDPNGWHWKTRDGVTHHSTGEAPTQPMYKAGLEIRETVYEVAREVFS